MSGLILAAHAGCTTITEELPLRPSDVPTPPPILAPGPPPTPAPPVPRGTPPPNPKPTPGPNDGKVVKLGIGVEYVMCNGLKVPNSEHAGSAKVGCQIVFESTPKDSNNKPTDPDGVPVWDFDPMSIVKKINGIDPYAPIVTGGKPGMLIVSARVDGVQSQTLRIQLYQ
jgi:hypothetical protein